MGKPEPWESPYTLICPSHRLCRINHQILPITPPQYISWIHLLLSISCYLLPQSQLPSFLSYLSTVYSLAQATIKYYRLAGLKKQKFIEFPEIYISPRSRSSRVGFWWEFCSWLTDSHLLSMCSHGLPYFSYKVTNFIRLGSHAYDLF